MSDLWGSGSPSGLEHSWATEILVGPSFCCGGLELVNSALEGTTQHVSSPLPPLHARRWQQSTSFPFCSPVKTERQNHQGVIVSRAQLPFPLSFTPHAFSSPIHSCVTHLSSPLCFLISLFLAIFPSQAIVLWSSIYIFNLNENDYISLLFFSIFIYLLYIWIEIYMYILLKRNI